MVFNLEEFESHQKVLCECVCKSEHVHFYVESINSEQDACVHTLTSQALEEE